MRSKIAIAAASVLAMAAVVTEVVAAQVVNTRPSWENVEGVWDMSNLPAKMRCDGHRRQFALTHEAQYGDGSSS